MKRTTLFNLSVLSLALMLGVTACHKGPKDPTRIPGLNPNIVGPGPGNMVDGGGIVSTPGNTSSSTGSEFGIQAAEHPMDFDKRAKNREVFAANTVHFDVDSATVRSSDASNLEAVASYMKSHPTGDLLIEGHCDERGTEGYNMSLGDKRANALREYLVNLGVSPDRVHTVSFGEAQPVDSGHDEAAWAKNRRGEFVFVEPAQ